MKVNGHWPHFVLVTRFLSFHDNLEPFIIQFNHINPV